MISPFKLNAALGRTYNTDLGDVLRTKTALNKLGHFETPSYGMTEYPDEPLFQGIEKFQEFHGLQKDGIIKPGGETEAKLGDVLAEKDWQAAKAAAKSMSILSPMPPTPDDARSEPNPDPTNEKSENEEEKQVAAAIAPAIPLIGEIPSAISALLGMLGLSSLLKQDTAEETERERFCREQLEDDTETCDGVWRTHGAAAAEKCRASAMERYANCLVGRPIQPLYKGTD